MTSLVNRFSLTWKTLLYHMMQRYSKLTLSLLDISVGPSLRLANMCIPFLVQSRIYLFFSGIRLGRRWDRTFVTFFVSKKNKMKYEIRKHCSDEKNTYFIFLISLMAHFFGLCTRFFRRNLRNFRLQHNFYLNKTIFDLFIFEAGKHVYK